MQVSDSKVHFRLKKLKGICMESMECLNKDVKKKKRGRFMYICGGDAKITTDTKSLDSPYAYHVSNGDAIKANI